MSKVSVYKQKMRDLYDLADYLQDQEARQKSKLSESGLMELRSQLQEKYAAAREAVKAAEVEILAELQAAAEREAINMLSVGNAENDFKLLSLPVKLSENELLTLAKKNKDNALFVRAVVEYAGRHGYDSREMHGLRGAADKAGKNKYVEAVNAANEMLRKASPSDAYYSNRVDFEKQRFEAFDSKGLFDSMSV